MSTPPPPTQSTCHKADFRCYGHKQKCFNNKVNDKWNAPTSQQQGGHQQVLSPCQGATCYVLRAEYNTWHATQMSLAQKGQQICLSVCLVVVQLWNASNSYGLVSKFNYVKYFTCQCSCPATSVRRLSVCPFGETTVPLSCCPVCHRASRSCGCQTKLAKKLLPLPLPLPQPQSLPLPLPSATS